MIRLLVHSEKRDLNWKGKVIRKSQYVDENTQSQEIFVQHSLRPEKALACRRIPGGHFPGQTHRGVMEIPRNSVFNSNEVFVVKNGRLAKQQINVVKENESTLIFNGLLKEIPWWFNN